MKRQNLWMTMAWLCCTAALALAQAAEAPPAAPSTAPAAKLRISTADEFKAEFEQVPCKNEARLEAVKALFEKLGAPPDAVTVAKFKGVENLVVTKPGKSSNKLVIGAHYDKTSEGCGAIDNWTGIVAIAHLYRTFKDFPTEKTLLFVAFGREEEGLIGSQAMVEAIKKQSAAAQYCAMYNIDSLGLAMPQLDDHLSSKSLVELGDSLAKKMEIPFAHGNIAGESDSASFLKLGIPALTLTALHSDWLKVLHTRNDQAALINETSVYLSYRLALSMLVRMDAADCQAFREGKK